MKELQNLTQDKLEINATKPIKKEHTIVGQLKPHRGHTVYSYNKLTREIKLAEFSAVNAHYHMGSIKKGYGVKKKILIEPDCIYISALNVENAIKKLKKIANAVKSI